LTFTSIARAQYGNIGDGANISIGFAQTFVKPSGSDANLCSRSSPCKTFNAAIGRTTKGGEVIAMESGLYDPVTITKAVTILAPPGVQATILSPADVNAVTITAGEGDVVVLRNLNLKSSGGMEMGVRLFSGEELHVEGLVIDGFETGVQFVSQGQLFVSDTTVRGRSLTSYGISIGNGPQAKATIERCRVERHWSGIGHSSLITVRDSVITGNVVGIHSLSFGAPWAARSVVENTVVTHNKKGIELEGFAFLWLANSTVAYNDLGLTAPANRIFAQVNNHNIIRWNQVDGTSPTLQN
jgi:hypothetical protein